MPKDDNIFENSDVRKELAQIIKNNINTENLDEALSLNTRERSDALGHIVIDAIKKAPLVSFSGVPHVYFRKHGYYFPFGYHELKTAVDEVFRRCKVPEGNYYKLPKVIGDCWSEIMCRKCQLNTSVVVMKNGVFDTMDMQLHDFSPNYMSNMCVDYEYNPNEYPVRWKEFLNQVLPDPSMQSLLQEFLAATYVDRKTAKIEHMLTLLGSGSNGKSVVFEVVMAALGPDNISTFSIRDLIGSKGSQNIAYANGKRLNYCSEMRTMKITEDASDSFKSLVSGEPMMARSLYKEPFKASNIPLVMTNANTMPKIDEASYSLRRRMLIIPFDVHITEERQNKELSVELIKEISGIFNWIMEGLTRLRKRKYTFNIPSRVDEIVAKYFADNNPVTRWLEDARMFATYSPNTESTAIWRPCKGLYDTFLQWCDNEGESKEHSLRWFIGEMERMGFERSRRSEGNGILFYHCPSKEELTKVNMDIAISLEKRANIQSLKEHAEDFKRAKVYGVDELERYLGLPEGSLWDPFSVGTLEGTYTRFGNGRTLFDVVKVQQALSTSGFYSSITSKTGLALALSSKNRLLSMRRSFNVRMKNMNIPIRKGNVFGELVSRELLNCWVVPDDWEYSPEAVKVVMETGRPYTINMSNGESNEEKDNIND